MENKEWYSIGLMKKDKLLKKLKEGSIIIKALYQNSIVGFLVAERNIDTSSLLAKEIKEKIEECIEMDNSCVLVEYRGNHLEKRMIIEAERILKSKDKKIKYSYVTVHPDNIASLKSLENIGYEKYQEKLMYGGLLRYIMRKEL